MIGGADAGQATGIASRSTVCPSGDQHPIEHGWHRAGIVDVGGGIRTLALDGVEVLDGYAETSEPAGRTSAESRSGRISSVGAELDFRIAQPIGDVAIDIGFTGLERDEDGIARISLDGPDRGYDVWLDRSFPHVQLSTGDLLPDVNRRAIAIGPMTCPPSAFATGESVVRLEPNESFNGTWGIATR